MARKTLSHEEALALFNALPDDEDDSEADGDDTDEEEEDIPPDLQSFAKTIGDPIASGSSERATPPGTLARQTRRSVKEVEQVLQCKEKEITKRMIPRKNTRSATKVMDEVLDRNLEIVNNTLSDHCDSESSGSETDGDDGNSEVVWSERLTEHFVSLPDFSEPLKPRPNFSPDECSSPGEFFCRFFDEELFDHLVSQTNLYAQQNSLANWVPTTVAEMKALFGILLFMAIHILPSVDHYWSSDPLLKVESICEVMTCKRFKKLLQALHCNDNSEAKKRGDEGYDKLHKIRPLIDKLNAKFLSEYCPSSCHSIDECMILFKGRSSMKQYMPLKPIKRGYKVWSRSDPLTGYMSEFDMYTGKDSVDRGAEDSGSTLGSRVVTKLCAALYGSVHPTLIVFDNFFSSVELLQILHCNNLYAVGTVRSNRRDLPPLLKKKNKLEKGSHIYFVKNNVCAIQWRDNRHVNIVTSAHDPNDVVEVTRTQRDGSRQLVRCPKAVRDYTNYMRGVDRFDQLRASYTVSRRSRKWWHRIFYFFIDSAMVNSFILYSLTNSTNSSRKHLDYHLSVAKYLVGAFSSRKRKGRNSANYQWKRFEKNGKPLGVPEETRFFQVGMHLPEELPTFRRCRLCSTAKHDKRTRICCSKCLVPLCAIPCFKTFHLK